MRTKQHVCALMPLGGTLVLNTLRYADEVLDPAEHAPALKTLDDARVSQREFGMAIKLVEDMRQKWEPEAFRDTYREDLLNRIEQKVEAGQTKTLTPAAAKASELRTAEVVDLSELLRRSLEKRGGKGGGTKRRANGDGAARAASEPAAPPSRARKASSPSTGTGAATRRRRSA
jgi:DNA end-binding protein Ku